MLHDRNWTEIKEGSLILNTLTGVVFVVDSIAPENQLYVGILVYWIDLNSWTPRHFSPSASLRTDSNNKYLEVIRETR